MLTNLLTKVIKDLNLKDEFRINLLDQLLKIIQIFINAAIQSDMSAEERAAQFPKAVVAEAETKEIQESTEQVQIPFV